MTTIRRREIDSDEGIDYEIRDHKRERGIVRFTYDTPTHTLGSDRQVAILSHNPCFVRAIPAACVQRISS